MLENQLKILRINAKLDIKKLLLKNCLASTVFLPVAAPLNYANPKNSTKHLFLILAISRLFQNFIICKSKIFLLISFITIIDEQY